MNDTMSLLVATAILATGGVGLYMYKSPDDETDEAREIYDESETDDTGFFGKGGFFSSSNGDTDDDETEHIKYEPKPKPRAAKTKRSRKNGGTKRRY